MTDPRIIFIGAPETAAADFPGIDLYCTNDRLDEQARAGSAEALIGHHFQFDEANVQAAPKLRWVQSRLQRHSSLSDCFAAMNSAQ